MKKLSTIALVGGICALVSCGPSAEEKAAKEKASQDSIAAVQKTHDDSLAATMDKAKTDSTSAADQKATQDSIDAAISKKPATVKKVAATPKTGKR